MPKKYTFNIASKGKKVTTFFHTSPSIKEAKQAFFDGLMIKRTWLTVFVIQRKDEETGWCDIHETKNGMESKELMRSYQRNTGHEYRVKMRKVQI